MSGSRGHPVWKRFGALWMAAMMLGWALGPSAALASRTPPQEPGQPESLIIGVLELDANNVDEGEARAIAERLRLYLSRQPSFEVIERNKMNSIMAELGFQLSGACDTKECVVQVGKILGARKMVAGSVSKVGNLYSLQVRIVDIESSRIEEQAFADVNGIEQVLQIATDSVARQLAQFVTAQRAREAGPEPEPVVQEEVEVPPVQEPPVQEQQPVEEEQPPAEEEKGGKWWLWVLLAGVLGGGAAAGLSAAGAGGEDGESSISLPPSRPPPTS